MALFCYCLVLPATLEALSAAWLLNQHQFLFYNMEHGYKFFLGTSSSSFSVFTFATDGWATTCMVMTALERSPKGTLHWPTILSFSKIFPVFISLMSLAPLGAIFLSRTYQNNLDPTLERMKTTLFYLDLCYMHPTIMKVQKHNFQFSSACTLNVWLAHQQKQKGSLHTIASLMISRRDVTIHKPK